MLGGDFRNFSSVQPDSEIATQKRVPMIGAFSGIQPLVFIFFRYLPQ